MKPLTVKSFIPGIAWFFVILILICLPGNDIPTPSGWFEWIKLIQFDKIVHSGIFAVLTFLFIYPVAKTSFSKEAKWQYFLKIAIAASIWGLTTELIQKFFIPTRSFELVDWAADTIGVVIALIFCRKFYLGKLKKEAL